MAAENLRPVPRDFCVIDVNGQVVMRGSSLDLPQIPGCETLAERAPEGCYRAAGLWIAMPSQPSTAHIFDWSAHAWTDLRELDHIRVAKLAEINNAFSAASAALTTGYPAAERQTWAAQEAEALAWGADNNSPTPYLDGIAAVRGIEVLDMRQKTFEAVNVFRVASQWLIGTRQALRDVIQNPNATRAQIEAITWPETDSQEQA